MKLIVSIQPGTGKFEVILVDFVFGNKITRFLVKVSEDDSTVVSGRVYITQEINQIDLPEPPIDEGEDESDWVQTDDIYKELNLRGYNYTYGFV